MTFGLPDATYILLLDYFRRQPAVERVIIYGSRAIGTYEKTSDIDLAFVADVPDEADAFFLTGEIKTDLEELPTPYRFDVTNLRTLRHDGLRDHIERKGVVFYERKEIDKTSHREGDNVSQGWKECKLIDIVNEFIDYRGRTPPKVDSGIPLVTAKIVKNGRILPPSEFIEERIYDSWMRRGLPRKNDIVITTEAPLGEVAILNNERIALAQRIILLRGKEEICDNFYLKYYLQSDTGQGELNARASGSTVEGIKASELRKIAVALPPLPEQKAIAEVLSSIDDKIDLLHRQNKTLEQLAETLFRQWFVEEAEEDWKTAKVGNFVDTNEQTVTKEYNHSVIQYLDTGSITQGRIEAFQEFNVSEAPSRAKRLVRHNDVLISTVRPNQKHYGIIKNPARNLVVSTGFCVLSCTSIDPHFVYLLLTSDTMTEFLHSIAEGSTSTYPSLKPHDIEEVEFSKPPDEKLHKFARIAADNWSEIEANYTQIKNLESLRDTLLPKLMSGEVRVKESQLEEVM